MSLDKAIKHGKEHRKPYTGSKVYFASCRNHGGCPWCEENRKHKFRDKHPCDLFLGQSDWEYLDDSEEVNLDVGNVGEYPIIVYLNNAIRHLLKISGSHNADLAISEICHAIHNGDGRLYEDVKAELKKQNRYPFSEDVL